MIYITLVIKVDNEVLELTTDEAKSNHLVPSLINPNVKKSSQDIQGLYIDEDPPLFIFFGSSSFKWDSNM